MVVGCDGTVERVYISRLCAKARDLSPRPSILGRRGCRESLCRWDSGNLERFARKGASRGGERSVPCCFLCPSMHLVQSGDLASIGKTAECATLASATYPHFLEAWSRVGRGGVQLPKRLPLAVTHRGLFRNHQGLHNPKYLWRLCIRNSLDHFPCFNVPYLQRGCAPGAHHIVFTGAVADGPILRSWHNQTQKYQNSIPFSR